MARKGKHSKSDEVKNMKDMITLSLLFSLIPMVTNLLFKQFLVYSLAIYFVLMLWLYHRYEKPTPSIKRTAVFAIQVLFFLYLEIVVLFTLILTGYNILSGIFLAAIVFCVFLILYFFIFSNKKHKKTTPRDKMDRKIKIISASLGSLIAIVALQGNSPIFQPKISLITNMETARGYVDGNNTYVDYFPDLEIYPALFPINTLTNCQDIPFVPQLRNVVPMKLVSSVTMNFSGDSLTVCTERADAWMWNKISIPIYVRSYQPFFYEVPRNNISFIGWFDIGNKKYYYYQMHFNNGNNNFPIYIANQTFRIYNDTPAWQTFSELSENCTRPLEIDYTEDVGNFSRAVQSNADMFYIPYKNLNDSIEIRIGDIFLDKWGSRNGYLLFNCYFLSAS